MSSKRPKDRQAKVTAVGRFNLGKPAAEQDPLLAKAFYPSPDFEMIASQEEPSVFLVGRTGSGKSAMFDQLRREYPGKVILLNPVNLALPYLTNLDVIRKLTDLGVHLEPFFRALWKHVFLVEVLRHRYQLADEGAKWRKLDELRRKLQNDPARRRALEYLEKYGDKFWAETDERVRQIAESFKQSVEAQSGGDAALQLPLGPASVSLGVRGGSTTAIDQSIEARSELTAKYQRIVNDQQLPRLNEMIVVLNDTILDSPQSFTYLYELRLDRCVLPLSPQPPSPRSRGEGGAAVPREDRAITRIPY